MTLWETCNSLANYELKEGEQGDVYDTTIYDRSLLDQYNNPLPISFSQRGITQAIMYISSTVNFNSPIKTITCSLVGDSVVRWLIQSGDIPSAGDYYVEIKLLDNSSILIRKTYEPLTMKVKPKLGP